MVTFEGKKILIVGATGGIGVALSKLLCKQGANVILAGKSMDKLMQLHETCASLDLCPSVIQMDLLETVSIQNAIQTLFKKEPEINCVIHAAGLFTAANFDDISSEEKTRLYAVNIMGPHIVTKEVAKFWKGTSYPKAVIFVSSIAGLNALPGLREVYAFSKRMVIDLFRKYYLQLGDRINFNCFCPGPVETRMLQQMCENVGAREGISSTEVLDRVQKDGHKIMSAEEVAIQIVSLFDENGLLVAPTKGLKEKQIAVYDFKELETTLEKFKT
jgi:NAD(P)-dependent dehydrogenase (short-subunit alcohol dehydrogenase family)